jgi:raffinose/stachyose/melibiose transport system substrate-binding protein
MPEGKEVIWGTRTDSLEKEGPEKDRLPARMSYRQDSMDGMPSRRVEMKRRNGLRTLMIVVLVLCCAALSFASGGNEGAGSTQGKTEVSFWAYKLGDQVKASMALFESKYPKYKLNLTEYESEDLKTQVRVAVAGGKAPDVFFSNEGFTFWEYVDRGSAMDITAVAKQRNWLERGYPEYLAADTDKNGRLWGMPWSGIHLWQVLYTNEDFFKKNNLPYPTTVDDMVALAPKIKAAGMQPISWGNKDGWPAILMIGDYMMQQSDPSIVDKLNKGTIKWTESDVARKAIDAMGKLGKGGAFVPGYNAQNHEAGIMGWVGGKAAFLYNGTWWPSVNNGSTNTGFKIGTITLPLIINSKTKVKDAAIDLLDYFTSFDVQKAAAQDGKCFVVHPGVNKVVDLDPIFKTEPFSKQFNLPKMGYFDHAFPIPVIEVMKVQLAQVMAGEVTVDQALATIESAHAAERGK